MNRILAAALVLILAGCTARGPVADTSRLYQSARAVRTALVSDAVVLTSAQDGRAVPVRVVYPDGEERAPLILFSHGMFSSNRLYMPILEYWAARGYIVVAPDHLDANRGWQPRSNDDVEVLTTSRTSDLALVMDSLPAIVAAVPALAGRIPPPPYVAAGHSVGTYVAMLQGGLQTRNPNTKAVIAAPDARIGWVVMSSDPGKMALMPEDLWLGSTVPTFMATGTEDFGTSGKGRRASEYTMERLSGDTAVPGSHIQVLIKDADHYYGGLVHRAGKNTPPDHEALGLFLSLSTAFLDAEVRDDAKARRFMRRLDLEQRTGGRANLIVR